MQKVVFLRTIKVAKGDGSGPTYEKGKAYWLRDDSVLYWRGEDAVIDAPIDMPAENERPPEPLRPEQVQIVRAGRNRYDVVVRGISKINDEPLTAAAAERLRQQILVNGLPSPAPVVATALEELPEPGAMEAVSEADPLLT